MKERKKIAIRILHNNGFSVRFIADLFDVSKGKVKKIITEQSKTEQSQIVSLVVDGWTWDEILKTHSHLTRDDIRQYLANAAQELDYDNAR